MGKKGWPEGMRLPGLVRREPHSGLKMFPRDVWPIAYFESLGFWKRHGTNV